MDSEQTRIINSQNSWAEDLVHCHEQFHNLRECFRVSSLINSSLELDEVLNHIMTTSRQILSADACSLMLVDEQTQELVFEVAQGPVADQLNRGLRLQKGQGIAGFVFETGEPLLIEDAYQDSRFHREFDLQTGYRTHSILCVPLKVKDRIIGVSQVINRLDGKPFDAEDKETLALLCTHAAIAIENARMHRALLRKQQMESDLAFATNIQLSFLPQEAPEIEGFRFKAHYQAAREIGGDLYDFIPLDEGRLGILIGDVSGKGVASALYMARLTSDFRLLAIRHKEPTSLIEHINNRLSERSCRGIFVTLLYMVLDGAERKLTYVNAGHIPPVLWNHGADRFEVVKTVGGPPLGIMGDRGYPSGVLQLEPGDCVLLSTDGLIEAKRAEGERLGWERVEAAMRGGDSRVEGVYHRVVQGMKDFVADYPQSDDTTLVLFGVEES
jgi:sigma-B regulation protein RsbU (phosphoserine phosphatase)